MGVVGNAFQIYKDTSLGDRLRIAGRLVLGGFAELIRLTPRVEGRVLDFGCGHGLYLNLLKKEGKIQSGVGVDIDREKLAIASRAAQPGVHFANEPLAGVPGPFEAILCCDVFYLIPFAQWPEIFAELKGKLVPQGSLVLKTVLRDKNWKHYWGVMGEFLAVNVLRITKTNHDGFVFLTREEWRQFLDQQGFEISSFEKFGRLPYNHALLICRKKN